MKFTGLVFQIVASGNAQMYTENIHLITTKEVEDKAWLCMDWEVSTMSFLYFAVEKLFNTRENDNRYQER